MKCNCNKAGAYIKVVQGNVLRLAIPLTLRTVEVVNGAVEATDTDFVPSSDHPVTVVLTRKGVRLRFDAVMRDGNVAHIEDRGTIPVGIYDITVCCKDDNGSPYRFKQNTVLSVKDATAEAGIVSPIDYELKTWYLNAAIYLTTGTSGITEEVDPVFSASPASGIKQSDIANWNGKVNPSALARVATSGSYNDLTDKPVIPEGMDLSNYYDKDEINGMLEDKADSADLSAVATTGSYNDLSNKPTIPSVQDVLEELPTFADVATTGDYSDLENTPNLATVATSGSYNDLTDKPTIPEGADLTGYATEQYVNTAIAGLVDSSPETLDTLNELADALGDDPNFATTMATQLGNKVDKVSGKGLSSNDYTTADKTKLAGLSNYDDTALAGRVSTLENAGYLTTETDPTVPSWAKAQTKPTYTAQEVGALPANTSIPSKTSDLTNDSGFIARALYYGTCTTAASTMPKVCTVETFPTTTSGGVTHAADGTIIAVKFTNSDTNTTAAPELNVNGIGAKAIMYNNAIVTSTAKNTTVAGYAKQIAFYRYDPEMDEGNGGWEFLAKSVDSNSTYSQASLGQGYAVQSNSAADTAITASISSYALAAGGIVSIKFAYDVPANATLNISSKGAKAIYNRGAAIAAGVIKAGDTATFIYSTYYHLISIDKWQENGKPLIANLTAHYDANDNLDHYTCDKTYAELCNAIDEGRQVYLFENEFLGVYLSLSVDDRDSEILSFSSFVTGQDGDIARVVIYDDDSITHRFWNVANAATFNNYVPTTRTVNGKALSSDITLNASDVGAMAEATVVEVSTAGAVSQALSPNTFYKFTGALTSLTLTLTAGTGLVVYAGKFTTGSGWGSNGLSIPATVTEATGNDEIAASKTYEFSILDNVIVIKEV